MVIKGMYKGTTKILRIYHNGSLIPFVTNEPVTEWEYPTLVNGVLTITQAYSASVNNRVLSIE